MAIAALEAETVRVGVDEIAGHFQELEDPRSSVNLRHPLVSVVVISIMAVLAGANGPTVIAEWARLKEELLLALLPNGIPRKDVFRRVLSILHPAGFQACFVSWLTSLRGKMAAVTGVEQPVLAIDGKTLRRSHNRSRGLGALHSVSLWATDYGLTLGQVATDEKSNAPFHLDRARRFPSCSSWSTSAGRSSRSTRWGRRRPSRKRSSAAGPTSCWG